MPGYTARCSVNIMFSVNFDYANIKEDEVLEEIQLEGKSRYVI